MSLDAQVLLNRTLSKVRFRHIQVVVLAADLGSTHKAAQEADIGQPSVVKYIADLEQLLEVSLFERHARGLRVTPICRPLLPLFRSMLRLAHKNAQSLADLMAGAAGVVHLGALPAACVGELMSTLARFVESYPAVHLHLHEGTIGELQDGLTNGTLDALITRKPALLPQGQCFLPVATDKPVILARTGHPLAGERSISIERLAKERWLMFPQNSVSRATYTTWFDGKLKDREVNFTTNSLSAAIEIIATSDILTVLPNSLATPALATGRVCFVETDRNDTIPPLGFAWREETALPVTTFFIDWVSNALVSNASQRI